MKLGIHAPKKGDKLDLLTMTAKNLSKKTKVKAVIIPKAKLMPIPSLLLKDDTETAKSVKTKVEKGILHLLCLTSK